MAKDWNGLISDAAGDVRRLDYVTRYSSIPVVYHETVAAHSYWVTVYSLMIHRELFPGHADLERDILIYAVSHDMGECITGDLVRTFKYSDPALKKAADDAEEKLAGRLPGRIRGLMSPTHARADRAYVKDVVKAADFLSLVLYMNRELVRGNQEILPFFERMEGDLATTEKSILDRVETEGAPYLPSLAGLYNSMNVTARNLHRMRIV